MGMGYNGTSNDVRDKTIGAMDNAKHIIHLPTYILI